MAKVTKEDLSSVVTLLKPFRWVAEEDRQGTS